MTDPEKPAAGGVTELTLNVTPHVTSDRSIIMKIDLKKDDVGDRTAADGKTPSKNTKSATTEVLVRDGETTERVSPYGFAESYNYTRMQGRQE